MRSTTRVSAPCEWIVLGDDLVGFAVAAYPKADYEVGVGLHGHVEQSLGFKRAADEVGEALARFGLIEPAGALDILAADDRESLEFREVDVGIEVVLGAAREGGKGGDQSCDTKGELGHKYLNVNADSAARRRVQNLLSPGPGCGIMCRDEVNK